MRRNGSRAPYCSGGVPIAVIIRSRRQSSLDPDWQHEALFRVDQTMLFHFVFLSVFVAGFVALGGVAPGRPSALERTALQSTASLERRLTSRIIMTVPADDAELVVNGQAVGGEGVSRTFETDRLDASTHRYTFTVTWRQNTYTTMTRCQ